MRVQLRLHASAGLPVLPLDFLDLLHSLIDAMNGLLWFLTVLLGSSSFFPNGTPGVQLTSAQYLLGLGQSCVFHVQSKCLICL